MYFDVDTMNVVNIKKKEEESWLQEMQFRGKSCVGGTGEVHEHVHVYVLLYFYVSETS